MSFLFPAIVIITSGYADVLGWLCILTEGTAGLGRVRLYNTKFKVKTNIVDSQEVSGQQVRFNDFKVSESNHLCFAVR